jgi:hypothetical protein
MVHQRELLINFTYANEGQGGISRKRVFKEGRKRVFRRKKLKVFVGMYGAYKVMS